MKSLVSLAISLKIDWIWILQRVKPLKSTLFVFSTFVAGEALGAVSLTTAALDVMMAYTLVPFDVYLWKKNWSNNFINLVFRIDYILCSSVATTYHTVTVVFSVWILQGLDA